MSKEILKPIPQESVSIVQSSKDNSTAETSANVNDTSVTLGRLTQIFGTLNGVIIPKQNFANPLWVILAGNVKGYSSVVYNVNTGTVTEANYSNYPLEVHFVPITRFPTVRTVNMSLAGRTIVPPSPFFAERAFVAQPPAYLESEIVIGWEPTVITDFNNAEYEWFIGVELRIHYVITSRSKSSGHVSVIQLVQAKHDGIDTGGQYWYDGSDFPYKSEPCAPEQQKVVLEYVDRPGSTIKVDHAEPPVTKTFQANFRTYVFYQDDTPGSIPVLLEKPLQWGLSFTAVWNASGRGEKGDVKIESQKVTDLSHYFDMRLPEWKNHAPSDRLHPEISAQGGTPMILSLGGPGDAARSVITNFSNYTDTFLSRTKCELDHGIWSTDLYPPESIGPGSSSSPTSARWASESQGSTTGTEGYALYTLQDGQTTVKVRWDNPYWGSNSYAMSVDGPLKDKYECSYTGGKGDNSTINVSFKTK